MQRIPKGSDSSKRKSILEDEHFIPAPGRKGDWESAINLSKIELNYVKLHGSFNWKSSTGSNMMVIGKDKENQISEEPLLAWYMELFKQVLYEEDRRLLIIGYGFQDKHPFRSMSSKMSHFLSHILFENHLFFPRFTRIQIDSFLGLPVSG